MFASHHIESSSLHWNLRTCALLSFSQTFAAAAASSASSFSFSSSSSVCYSFFHSIDYSDSFSLLLVSRLVRSLPSLLSTYSYPPNFPLGGKRLEFFASAVQFASSMITRLEAIWENYLPFPLSANCSSLCLEGKFTRFSWHSLPALQLWLKKSLLCFLDVNRCGRGNLVSKTGTTARQCHTWTIDDD